jgi:hypothetical protein
LTGAASATSSSYPRYSRGQFWPGLGIDRSGLSHQLFLPKV